MSKMEAHTIFIEDETGTPTKVETGWITPAKQEDVDYVLAQDPESPDGRSSWVWVRLQNGDLMLATFPQGDTYCYAVDGMWS